MQCDKLVKHRTGMGRARWDKCGSEAQYKFQGNLRCKRHTPESYRIPAYLISKTDVPRFQVRSMT